jgi:hypothetical protein
MRVHFFNWIYPDLVALEFSGLIFLGRIERGIRRPTNPATFSAIPEVRVDRGTSYNETI